MGHYITKRISTDVDFEIELDDALEYILSASDRELKEMDKAVSKMQNKRAGRHEPSEDTVQLEVHCRIYEEFQAGQLQEVINRLGIEEALQRLQA